jgi:hypothetical protein
MNLKPFFLVGLVISTQIAPAYAEPPINSPLKTIPGGLSKKVFISGECWVVTNFPHLSTHAPGRVNVTATIYCPRKPLSIETKLTRTANGLTSSRKSVKSGVGKISVNVSMPCIWKSGAPNVYKAQSWFTNGDGQIYTHSGISELKC